MPKVLPNKFIGIYCLLIILSLILNSCKGLQKETMIYQNNFEGQSLFRINGGIIGEYNGSRVLGRYSENGFVLKLDSLPVHNMIQIRFDLYIHDTWDGNKIGPDGPDIWIMNIDGNSNTYSTFANGLCTDCNQSYPVLQPSIVNNTLDFFKYWPNSNAIKTDLPGACKLKDIKGGTSKYEIVRTFNHTQNTIDIGCFAQLEDADIAGKNCNESWSVDNIEVKAIEFN